MVKRYYKVALIILAGLIGNTAHAEGDPIRDSLTMGAGYANDLFYSFENGEISSIERDDWEIAFFTSGFSAGIITNGGVGVVLYNYPNGDTSDWATVDTTGFFGWSPLYNSPANWEEGAFNRNSQGFPDYGWGIYNMDNHHIVGDSLFIIDSPYSGLKKVWIIEKDPMQNIYSFRFANMDGTNEYEVELDVSTFSDNRFAYYSLTNNEALSREPKSDSWDILFTKYIDMVPDIEGNLSPYIVTGVLANVDIASNQFYPVAPDFTDWASQPMDSIVNTIGYDWKSFDMGLFEWTIQDSNYYFIQDYAGNIYKLGFVWWNGSSTGDFAFDKQFITTVSVNEMKENQESFQVFPNPASNHVSIKAPSGLEGNFTLSILDQSGRQVYIETFSDSQLSNGVRLADIELPSGFYLISITGNNYAKSQKLIVR